MWRQVGEEIIKMFFFHESIQGHRHKVHILNTTGTVPSSELEPLHYISPQRVPPEPMGVTHSPAGEGVGWSQFEQLEKKPSTLSALWSWDTKKESLFILVPYEAPWGNRAKARHLTWLSYKIYCTYSHHQDANVRRLAKPDFISICKIWWIFAG